MLNAQEPGAGREERVAQPRPPGVERLSVGAVEFLEAEEGLDALPLVPARDAGAESAARLARGALVPARDAGAESAARLARGDPDRGS